MALLGIALGATVLSQEALGAVGLLLAALTTLWKLSSQSLPGQLPMRLAPGLARAFYLVPGAAMATTAIVCGGIVWALGASRWLLKNPQRFPQFGPRGSMILGGRRQSIRQDDGKVVSKRRVQKC